MSDRDDGRISPAAVRLLLDSMDRDDRHSVEEEIFSRVMKRHMRTMTGTAIWEHANAVKEPTQRSEFSVGDVVSLKSGGPEMCVRVLGANEVDCTWFDTTFTLRVGSFDRAMLDRVYRCAKPKGDKE